MIENSEQNQEEIDKLEEMMKSFDGSHKGKFHCSECNFVHNDIN